MKCLMEGISWYLKSQSRALHSQNEKVAKNNMFLGWIVGVATVFGVIATISQAIIAYYDYKKDLQINEYNMSKKEEQKQEEVQPQPKRKGRKPQEIERKLPLTKEEEEMLKKSKFGRLLGRV